MGCAVVAVADGNRGGAEDGARECARLTARKFWESREEFEVPLLDARAAVREALEEAGTYLESLTVVHNMRVKKDDVLALAAGVLRVRIIEEAPYMEGRALGMRVVAEVRVDTAGLEERVHRLTLTAAANPNVRR